MKKICAMRTRFFPDNWGYSPKKIAVIVSDSYLSNPDYSETGYQDPTDYPALLIKIVKDLAKKGLSNGLEIIALGIQLEPPKELQSFSNISYIQLPRELNGKINSFVRDGLFFCTSGDAVVAVGDNPNLEAINFQWDDFSHKKVSGSSDLFKGGQTLITHNKDGQRFVMIGEDDFLKKYVHQGSFFSKDKIIEVFYESEFNRALSHPYGVEKALLIPQTPNIVPQIPGNVSDLYRKFYENFAGMYYHLDVNMLCLPNGIMVINDMSQVARLVINLLKTPENLEYMNNLLFDKKLPYNELKFALVKFYIEIARTYKCFDKKLENFLSQNNFTVVKAPLMMCLPFGSITMSLANGVPGFNTDGTPVFYTGEPSNVFEKAIYEQFKGIVSEHLKMDIICIDSVSELTKKTLSGLRCITAPVEAFDGFPNTIFDSMNFLTEKHKDDWLESGTEVTV